MSRFANPASDAEAAGTAYTTALLDTLGKNDPMVVFRGAPERYRELIDQFPTALLTTPELPGKWSAMQILHHLVDSELVGAIRFRRALAEDRPAIQGYDQDAWCAGLHPTDDPAREAALALDLIDVVRASTVRLLESLDAGQWQRVILHSERGEESVEHMLKLYAAHDLVHLGQMERVRKAVTGDR